MLPKDQKMKLAVTAGLVLILIFVVNNSRQAVKKVKQRRKKTLHSKVLKEKKGSEEKDLLSKIEELPGKEEVTEGLYRQLEEKTKDLALNRDPFTRGRVSTKQTIESSGPALSGIIWDEKSPRAVINNQIIRVGDTIGKNVVIEITPDSVTLDDGSRYLKLSL